METFSANSGDTAKGMGLQEAIVLHTRPFRNTSLLVDFFTKEQGVVRCVAKGQRSKKNASQLSQFCIYQVALSGKSDLKSLVKLELDTKRYLLQKQALFSGLYLNEVLLRVLYPHDPHPEVFDLVCDVFAQLAAVQDLENPLVSLEKILRCFEFSLLNDIGYLVDMKYDCQTGELIQELSRYTFDVEQGFTLVQAPSKKVEGQKSFSGRTIQLIADMNFETLVTYENLKLEAKIISRLMLAPYIGDKPLQSKALFSKIT